MSRTRPRRDWTKQRWAQHKQGVLRLSAAFAGSALPGTGAVPRKRRRRLRRAARRKHGVKR